MTVKGTLGGIGRASGQVLGILSSPLVQLAIVGIVGLVLWRKIFGGSQTVADVVNNTIQGASDVAAGLPGLVSDTLTGTNDSTYITQAQAKAKADAALASSLAAKFSKG